MDRELGRTGARRYGGLFYEEFLPELQGVRGVRVRRKLPARHAVDVDGHNQRDFF